MYAEHIIRMIIHGRPQAWVKGEEFSPGDVLKYFS